MKMIQNLLVHAWEKVAFWCMTLLFVVVLVLWFAGFGHEKPAGASTHAAPQERHYLNPATALAFTEEMPVLNIKSPNLFSYAVRQRGQPPHPPPPNPIPIPIPTPRPVGPVVPPTPRITQRMIEYQGTMTTTSGQTVALLLDRNSGETSVVQAGATFKKYKIKSFSPKEAVAEDDKGAEVVFPLGKQTGIPLE